jgi:hypothetical protein
MSRKTLDEVVLGNHPELHARYKKFLDPTRIMDRHPEGAKLEEVNMQHNVWAILENAKILARDLRLPLEQLARKDPIAPLIAQHQQWYDTHGPESVLDILALHSLTDIPNWEDYNDESRFTSWERSLHVFQTVDEAFRDLGDNSTESVAYRIGRTAMKNTNLGRHHNLVKLLPVALVYDGSEKQATRFNNVTQWKAHTNLLGLLGIKIEIIYNKAEDSPWNEIDGVPVLYIPEFDFNGQDYSLGILDGVPTMFEGKDPASHQMIRDGVLAALAGDSPIREDGRQSTILQMKYRRMPKPRTLVQLGFSTAIGAGMVALGTLLPGTGLDDPMLYVAAGLTAKGVWNISHNIGNKKVDGTKEEAYRALETLLDETRANETSLAEKVDERTKQLRSEKDKVVELAKTVFQLQGDIVGLQTSYERHDIVNHLREINSELQRTTVKQLATGLYDLFTRQGQISGAREYLVQANEELELELDFEAETSVNELTRCIEEAMIFGEDLLETYEENSQRFILELEGSANTNGIEAILSPAIEKIRGYNNIRTHMTAIHKNVDKIRDLLKEVNTEVDLPSTVTESLDQLSTSYKFSYSVHVEGERDGYRIQSIKDLFIGAVADLARNSIKHGKAKNIDVTLGRFSSLPQEEQERYKREMHIAGTMRLEYYLTIADDGIGIDPQKAQEITQYVNDRTQETFVNHSTRTDGSGGEGTANVKRFGSLQNAYSHFQRVEEGGTKATIFFTSKTMF